MGNGNFFGAFEEDTKLLKEGDLVEIFPNFKLIKGRYQGNKRFSKLCTFSHIGGPRGEKQMVRGKMVRCVFLKESGINVRDTAQWTRIPKPPAPGFFRNRVCLYVDPETDKVATVPRNG